MNNFYKYIFLSLIFILSNCKSVEKCNCDTFLIKDGINVPILKTYCDTTKTLYTIVNDSEREVYYNLHIIGVKNKMFEVIPNSIQDTIKNKGWIKNNYVGIYVKNYNRSFNLYSEPSIKREINFTVTEYFTHPVIVKSCKENWLYVDFEIDKKQYRGWLSPEDQCANIYTTCN